MWFLSKRHPLIRPAVLGIGSAALLSLLVFGLLMSPVRVEGISMSPSLAPSQRLIVSPLMARLDLERRDLIVLNHPTLRGVTLIKRVAALAGDRFRMNENGIFVNGSRISPWTTGSCSPVMDITIPSRHVFVLGDNLNHSMDSRLFGPVPLDRIQGKVLFRYWPISRLGIPR